MAQKKIYSLVKNILFYGAISLFVLIVMFPFIWQALTSFKPPEQINKMPPDWWPGRLWIEYYVNVFTKRPFLLYLKNSAVVSITTTIVSLAVGSFCAYALARLRFRGKKVILALVLSVSMFPHIATLSPMFLFLRKMELLNTYTGLVLPYTTFALPLTIWTLTSFFRELPKELEEAAIMDGCSRIKAFWKVTIPLAAPGMFTTAILVFIAAWNEFLYALSFMTQDGMRTVPPGIAMFPGEHDLPWGDIAAASVVVTVPLIILVLIFQRRIIAGLTSGGVKG
ncbi:sugar ABC transporter permease [[Bacillus] caldolyticus]|uniref:Sugar ABC transporter permease n=1 Tax=Bacillus caldolyticus TaxID=1394 RepID=A0ABM6QRS3_BACCL|nr:carbohydrate ABC transporter permease [[Bacillus] caldolyticus]AUI38161.1 sugar ABC transporter permease [[Bacillus] caldolyticus]